MDYIIENYLIFDRSAYKLKRYEDDNHIFPLSNPATRLLTEMLKAPNHLLNRDFLIKTVWDDYGYSGSSISLNIAVSELRKVFRESGLHKDILQTIRGSGLILSADVTTVRKAPPPLNLSIKQRFQCRKTRLNYLFISRKNIAIASLSLMFIISATAIHSKQQLSISKPYLTFIMKNDKCSFYLIDKHNEPVSSFVKESINNIKSDNNEKLNCNQQYIDIFISPTKKIFNEYLTAGLCYKSEAQSSYSECITARLQQVQL